MLAVAATALPQVWMPNETLMSAQKDLLDFEFSFMRGQFTWNDQDGKLWVGNVDRDTGMFYPPDGKGTLVDADAMSTSDVLKTGNGPEWAWSAAGDVILYTKFASKPHSQTNVRLGYAYTLADGNWSAGFLGPENARKAPYGSETIGDTAPRATYVDADNNHYWREIGNPATEQALPDTAQNVTPVRHVRGARALMYGKRIDRVTQVFYRDLDTGVITQLTFDRGDKDPSFMWQAPEFGNEFVFLTVVGKSGEVRIYRNLQQPGTGTFQWTAIHSVFPPPDTKIVSPEPFTYNGKSYISMALVLGRTDYSSEVWISNIDSANPLFRRISDNAVLRARTDPEVFITNRGPLVYYNRRQLQLTPRGNLQFCGGVKCSEGIYMADPGLGP